MVESLCLSMFNVAVSTFLLWLCTADFIVPHFLAKILINYIGRIHLPKRKSPQNEAIGHRLREMEAKAIEDIFNSSDNNILDKRSFLNKMWNSKSKSAASEKVPPEKSDNSLNNLSSKDSQQPEKGCEDQGNSTLNKDITVCNIENDVKMMNENNSVDSNKSKEKKNSGTNEDLEEEKLDAEVKEIKSTLKALIDSLKYLSMTVMSKQVNVQKKAKEELVEIATVLNRIFGICFAVLNVALAIYTGMTILR